MLPIHQLVDRIRWDKAFADADFKIGFFDRPSHDVIYVPLKEIQFDQQDPYFFHFYDEEGEEHNVPLHRIKSVYRNGELIWHREH